MKAAKNDRAAEQPKHPPRVWPGGIPLESLYTAGVGGQIFLRALKERGELVGTRCAACAQVYVPARAFCERCFAELSEEVAVKPEGTLVSFTFSYFDHDGRRLETPQALALVRFEGATTVFLHRLLKVSDPEQVESGARVRAVIKPKAKRSGSILDVEGFELI
ncbi:MAG: Zn-ribbon domain-containing OB-fold protein [Acidobacteria bacterium]|nr:Zn-ribbon domain-containing OB-fold protein [Acidobacteriota bacterium]